jgi:hypothetical protein
MLFSVSMDGSRRQIQNTRFDGLLLVSPDSRFAIYAAAHDDGYGVFAADLATGVEHRLCNTATPSVTDDSRYVFCRGSADAPLEIVRLDDGAPVYSAAKVRKFVTSHDSRTAFVCKPDHTADFVDLETGMVTPLADDIGDCVGILFMPDNGTVVYGAQDGKLMAAPVDGGAPIVLDQEVSQPGLPTPDSARIIYVRATDAPDRIDLYVTDISGLQEPILLIADMPGTFADIEFQLAEAADAFRVDSDSQAMFATVHSPNAPSIELRRLKLDGSQDISFTYLCDFNCGPSLKWYADEARGVVYMHKPFGKVQTRDIATGAVIAESDDGFGFGIVAPNLSGSVSISNRKDALVWLSFPDLTYTLIRPWPFDGLILFESPDEGVTISPDGTMLMFKSDFGGRGAPTVGTTDHRIMIQNVATL